MSGNVVVKTAVKEQYNKVKNSKMSNASQSMNSSLFSHLQVDQEIPRSRTDGKGRGTDEKKKSRPAIMIVPDTIQVEKKRKSEVMYHAKSSDSLMVPITTMKMKTKIY